MHERDSWLLFFRDVVVVQFLVCSSLGIQSVLKKSAVNQVSTYTSVYLTGEISKTMQQRHKLIKPDIELYPRQR